MRNMKTKVILLSGGSGKRFGADIPKQYIEIKGKPVLAYALEAFQESCADEIIIVSGKDYIDKCREIAARAGASKLTAVIEGGSERYISVMNGLKYLAGGNVDSTGDKTNVSDQNFKLADAHDTDSDIVLIHDGARPFVTKDLISDVVSNVTMYGAAIAAVPCTDTIKITDENGMIISTTDRKLTWAAQTPQGFYLNDIYHAYEFVLSGKNVSIPLDMITDDAMVYQLYFPDRKVKAVKSDPGNIKITRAQDLRIAETFAF